MYTIHSLLSNGPRHFLASLLIASSVSKFFGGHSDQMLLPKAAYNIVISLEMVMSAALYSNRYTKTAGAGACLLSAGGLVAAMATDRPCGCLGRGVALSPGLHAVLASAVGLLGFWVARSGFTT